jgi:hypothetical protein
MKAEIFNKSGFLSAYGLSCGRIQKNVSCAYEVQLYREHGIYHVRNIKTSDGGNRTIISWKCYETLLEAKKQYKLIIKNNYKCK